MDGSAPTPTKPTTYLQRAFDSFTLVAPNSLTGRGLAAILRCEIRSAYNFIERLKRMNKIVLAPDSTARVPSYVLAEGATRPPDDNRGRKASRPPTDVSRWKAADGK